MGGDGTEELPVAGWGGIVATPGAPDYAGATQDYDGEDEELGSPQEGDLDIDVELSPAY